MKMRDAVGVARVMARRTAETALFIGAAAGAFFLIGHGAEAIVPRLGPSPPMRRVVLGVGIVAAVNALGLYGLLIERRFRC